MKKMLIPACMLALFATSCSDKKDTNAPEVPIKHLVKIVDGESGASQSTTMRIKDGVLMAIVDSAGTDVSIDTLIYKNGLLHTIGEKSANGEVSVDKEFVYTNNQITKVHNRAYEREHENITDYDSIVYDATGNPVKIFTKGGEPGKVAEKMVKELTWDAKGNITAVRNGGYTGTGYVYFQKREFTYDNNNNPLAKATGTALVRYYLYEESLISACNITKVINYIDPALQGNWVLNYLTTYTYTYDNDKDVTSVTSKEGATEATLSPKAYYLFHYSK